MEKLEHQFGGIWTEIKLKILRGYLHAYTQALKNQPSKTRPFKLLYIDAFAGTGYRTIKTDNLDLFISERRLQGSAKIALDLEQPFDQYIFIELNKKRYKALQRLQGDFPSRKILFLRGDANEELKNLCTKTSWHQCRAVLFLDPYGLSVDWTTLPYIASTKAIDLWYLSPLSGIYRQLPHNFNRIDPLKAAQLTRLYGTSEWQEKFYGSSSMLTGQGDLFGDSDLNLRRHANVDVIENFDTQRLQDAGFSKVLKPLRLPLKKAPLFSLFFCISNPSSRAIGLSTKIADHLLKAAYP